MAPSKFYNLGVLCFITASFLGAIQRPLIFGNSKIHTFSTGVVRPLTWAASIQIVPTLGPAAHN